jgi:quercetin dioxygenase-like cupin family protein
VIKKTQSQVPSEPVIMDGVNDTTIQWLYSRTDGAPNFSMRRFVIKPGGKIGLHEHPWEHEIYFISGKGIAFTDKEKVPVSAGDTIYLPGGEPHGYTNDSMVDLVFICMIPNSGDKRPQK